MTQGLILAAGLGTRCRPLTNTTPKPMLQVLGKPLIDYILESLYPYVNDIIIVVGYLKEKIIEHVGKEYKGKTVTYVDQPEQLGNGHALLCAENNIRDKFIVVPADDLIMPFVIAKLEPHDLCIIAKKVKHPERFGILELNNNHVINIEEKPHNPKSNLANTAVWKMDRKLVDAMKLQTKSQRGELEITDALRAIAKNNQIYCEVIDKGWVPVGYPEDLKTAENELKRLL